MIGSVIDYAKLYLEGQAIRQILIVNKFVYRFAE